MQFTTTFAGIASVLVTLVSATPAQAGAEIIARQSPTGASVTSFSVVRNATHVNYAATIAIAPGGSPLAYTHATAGTTVPTSSGFWTSSNPNALFRFNRVPLPSPGQYRLLLTVAQSGTSFNFDYFSPVSDWAGTGTTIYTGPSSFSLD
ncbi:hypothetical protein B0T25DRAFT_473952 [Lasiosphaeria hispida]|uniref:Uncharacterized protein n=1 Tax=Lasiosphaeria hispida TaxID=260671 RepID=A0AAJ0HT07_9PEZI|nr:hypothetical protein B0T25DRAFT_473952 [Lasiosphaeria hispida]